MADLEESQVPVRNPRGEIVTIPKDRLQHALASGDYTRVTPEEFKSHQEKVQTREKFEGVLPGLGAVGIGALRQASFGGSDALAVGLANIIGGEDAQHRVSQTLSDLNKYQSAATGFGELLGFGVPALATGGLAGVAEGGAAGLAELGAEAAPTVAEAVGGLTAKGVAKGALRAVSAPLRGVNAAGEAVEHGLAAAIGGGAKVLPMAARAGLEGAALGAGNALSEQAMSQDPEITAEHIMPDILSGAIGGLVFGGAAGTVLKGAKALFSKAKPLVGDVVDQVAKVAEEHAGQAAEEGVHIQGGPGEGPVAAAEGARTPPTYEEGRSAPSSRVAQTPESNLAEAIAGKGPSPDWEARLSKLEGIAKEANATPEELARQKFEQEQNEFLTAHPNPYTESAPKEKPTGLGGFNPGREGPAAEYEQPKIEEELPTPTRRGKEVIPEENKTLGGMLREKSDLHLFKALGPYLNEARRIDRYNGGVKAVARDLREMYEKYGEKPIITSGNEDFVKFGKKLDGIAVEKLESHQRRLSSLPYEYQPKTDDLLNELSAVEGKLKGSIGQSSEGRAIQKLIDETREKALRNQLTPPGEGTFRMYDRTGAPMGGGRISFDTLADIRNDFKNLAFPGGKARLEVSPLNDAYVRLRAKTRDLFFREADKAGEQLGPDFVKGFKEANREYEIAKIVSKVAEDHALRNTVNAGVSLTDVIAGSAGLAVSPLTGIASLVGNHVRRHYGNVITSELLGRASKLFTVNEAAQAAEKNLTSSVAAFLSPGTTLKNLAYAGASEPVFAGTTPDERQKSFDKFVDQLQGRIANPQQQFADITQRIGDMGTVAPQVAAQVVQKRLAAEQYLASKIPQRMTDNATIFPNKAKTKLSDAEIAKFGRYVSVAQHGAKVLLNELKAHNVSRETVDAVKVMYPATYAKIQQEILKQAAERPNDLTYQQKLQLYPLFGISTDRTLSPQVQALLQNNYAKQMNRAQGLSPSGKPRKSSSRALGISKQFSTGIQRIEGGI